MVPGCRPKPSGAKRDLAPEPVILSVAVDHGQFVVLDGRSEVDVDSYDQTAQRTGLASWEHGFAVFCESHWTDATRVELTLHPSRPEVDIESLDWVTQTAIRVDSGEVRVFAPEETGLTERPISIPRGTYGVIVAAEGFGKTDEYGDNGADRYQVHLWPAKTRPPLRVLKPTVE